MASPQTQVNRVSPGRIPRLCISLQAPTTTELFAAAERALRETDLIELRLDGLKTPAAAVPHLREFLRSMPQAMVIATCRKKTYGGLFRGSVEAEWAILAAAGAAGSAFIDLEVQSAERVAAATLARFRERANLIISYHDFHKSPEPGPLLRRMQAIPADIYKLATTATSWKHNLRMLRFLEEQAGGQRLVAFCMGEVGLASRVLSLRAGSAFTFASPVGQAPTAPGQIDWQRLRQLYRAEALNRASRIYGVVGYPLEHSLSPQMHNVAFHRSGVNAVYLPLLTRKLEDVIESAALVPLSGFSVTHPYKRDILPFLDGMDKLAEAVGAVNTVVRSQDKLYGYNTDVAGIIEPLAAVMPLRGARILVVGAGGAARAAVFGLRSQGAQVSIVNRTRGRGQALAAAARARLVSRTELRKLDFAAIINATPVGQAPRVKESPLTAEELRAPVVFDLVYNPLETALLQMARARGARVISGVEMFVHQGARQFELWTGKPAPSDDMRRAVLAALA